MERDDLVLGVEVSGTLKAVKTDLLGPPQLRRLWRFNISHMAPEGEEVAAGTPVLAFDDSELQQRLQREMAERDAAQKRIERAETELALRRKQDLLRLAEAQATKRKAELKAESPGGAGGGQGSGQGQAGAGAGHQGSGLPDPPAGVGHTLGRGDAGGAQRAVQAGRPGRAEHRARHPADDDPLPNGTAR